MGLGQVPEYVVAVVELLKALPPEEWPKRWRVG